MHAQGHSHGPAHERGVGDGRELDPDGVFYRCAGTRFLVYPSPGVANGAHTQMTWHTDDIHAVVSALKSRGVAFDEIDIPELKTVNGVATIERSKGARFKDSEGNVLALGQFGVHLSWRRETATCVAGLALRGAPAGLLRRPRGYGP